MGASKTTESTKILFLKTFRLYSDNSHISYVMLIVLLRYIHPWSATVPLNYIFISTHKDMCGNMIWVREILWLVRMDHVCRSAEYTCLMLCHSWNSHTCGTAILVDVLRLLHAWNINAIYTHGCMYNYVWWLLLFYGYLSGSNSSINVLDLYEVLAQVSSYIKTTIFIIM